MVLGPVRKLVATHNESPSDIHPNPGALQGKYSTNLNYFFF